MNPGWQSKGRTQILEATIFYGVQREINGNLSDLQHGERDNKSWKRSFSENALGKEEKGVRIGKNEHLGRRKGGRKEKKEAGK